jgi:rhomboid protease GluP
MEENMQDDHSAENKPTAEFVPSDTIHPPDSTSLSEHSVNEDLAPAPSLSPMGGESSQPFYKRNPFTISFSILLILIYGLTSFTTEFKGPADLVVMLGGFYPPAVQAGEWWRFITASLLHANPGHLFNNVVGLLIFGNLLEPVIGSWRMLWLYIISAVAGLGLSYFMLPEGMTFGASTIDYGLIGAYLTLVLMLRYRYNRQAFFSEFRGAIIFVLLFVGWNTLESSTVNLWGHLGGLFGGVVFAIWLGSKPRIKPLPKG